MADSQFIGNLIKCSGDSRFLQDLDYGLRFAVEIFHQ